MKKLNRYRQATFNYILPKGKYEGQQVKDIIEKDSDYLIFLWFNTAWFNPNRTIKKRLEPVIRNKDKWADYRCLFETNEPITES